MFTPHGAFAEYAIAWAYTTSRIPAHVSFEEASTIPLASITAALGLYSNLRLPLPWTSDEDRPEAGPLVIYGAGTAVGSFAVQFAMTSQVHPIICVAGQSRQHVKTLIDRTKGDVIIDYRLGAEFVIASIIDSIGKRPLLHAFDAVSEKGSDKIIGAVLEPKMGKLTMTLPNNRTKIPEKPGLTFPEGWVFPHLEGVPKRVETFWTAVGSACNTSKHFAYIFYRYAT